ncbi:MAG: RsbRD N-terminal domain-containing protein [bacterium]
MSLEEILQGKRQTILQRWLDLVLESYSPDTSKFLKRKKDQFGNPVGHALTQGLGGLCDAVLDGRDLDEVQALLEDVIRIRAVQELPPSVGVGFVFGLKQALDDVLRDAQVSAEERRELDRRVDALALRAFDHYVACRHKIYELRIYELKSQTMDVRELVARRKAQQKDKPSDNNGA